MYTWAFTTSAKWESTHTQKHILRSLESVNWIVGCFKGCTQSSWIRKLHIPLGSSYFRELCNTQGSTCVYAVRNNFAQLEIFLLTDFPSFTFSNAVCTEKISLSSTLCALFVCATCNVPIIIFLLDFKCFKSVNNPGRPTHTHSMKNFCLFHLVQNQGQNFPLSAFVLHEFKKKTKRKENNLFNWLRQSSRRVAA